MTWLRSALFNLVFLGGTVLTVLFGTLLLAAPAPLMVRYIRGWAGLVLGALRLICGIRVEVTGLQHVPSGPTVIAAKHQSAFDTVVWLALLPPGRDPVYVLKQELANIPLWGRLAARCGHISLWIVPRVRRRAAGDGARGAGCDRGGPARRHLSRGSGRRRAKGCPTSPAWRPWRARPARRSCRPRPTAACTGAGGLPEARGDDPCRDPAALA